jgi:hypothetical protein
MQSLALVSESFMEHLQDLLIRQGFLLLMEEKTGILFPFLPIHMMKASVFSEKELKNPNWEIPTN